PNLPPQSDCFSGHTGDGASEQPTFTRGKNCLRCHSPRHSRLRPLACDQWLGHIFREHWRQFCPGFPPSFFCLDRLPLARLRHAAARHPVGLPQAGCTFNAWFLTSHDTLLTPGPVEVSAKTLAAFSRPIIGHRVEDFKNLYREIPPRLQELFGTKEPVFLSTSS